MDEPAVTSPAALRAIGTLQVYALACGIASTRRIHGSRAQDVRLRVPPIDLPAEVWQRVAAQIIEMRPGWHSVTLADARNRQVAAATTKEQS